LSSNTDWWIAATRHGEDDIMRRLLRVDITLLAGNTSKERWQSNKNSHGVGTGEEKKKAK
jgi:hypothetical protein